jgi:beta-galactosidase
VTADQERRRRALRQAAGSPVSRRGFLALTGAGLVGAVMIGAAGADSAAGANPVPPSDQWLFGQFVPGCTDTTFDGSDLTQVTLPHCVAPLSWSGWQPESWQERWVYRRSFNASAAMRADRTWVRFEGVLTNASLFLNGRLVGEHNGGYLPFEFELTGALGAENVLAVVVDGRWQLDVPPNLPHLSGPATIDFYQPAGIYRSATVYSEPLTRLVDVFARPLDVLSDGRYLEINCVVDSSEPVDGPVRLVATVTQSGTVLADSATELPAVRTGRTAVQFDVRGLAKARLWDVDDPALCEVDVSLSVGPRSLGHRRVRIGFREARFGTDGFFLNGRRLKLFGLNRHQWYPFVGGAMPDRVQRKDAEILKNELNCNMVRCSHYPQSTAFLDACDDLGLLVWEEIPGWGYVGDGSWQAAVLQNVEDMVTRDRNHPAIVVWGTRINETLGETALYGRTSRLAGRLDPSRPTSGALAGSAGYRLSLSEAADEQVFAYNDYTARRGEPFELRPPRSGVPYLVTEAVGTMSGPRYYRRADPASTQQQQAVLHASAHDLAAGDNRYCGLLAWCAFDYPSGWYHSADGLKSPGVVDIFRIPKLGAGFYRSQVDPDTKPVIEPGFHWDLGPDSPRGGPGTAVMIWSNCEKLVLYLDEKPIGEATSRRARFPHLRYPPFAANLVVPTGRKPDLRIDGFVGDRLVLTRRFSANSRLDVLSCVADDAVLVADGSDATRVVVRAVDRFGAPRPYASGAASFDVSGPGVLVGQNPFDLGASGGAAAVWLKSVRGTPGQVVLRAQHPKLGAASVRLETRVP